jgi:hypothetical protein
MTIKEYVDLKEECGKLVSKYSLNQIKKSEHDRMKEIQKILYDLDDDKINAYESLINLSEEDRKEVLDFLKG